MKTKNLLRGLATVGLLSILVIGTAWSQKSQNQRPANKAGMQCIQGDYLKLSDEQKDQMKSLRLEFMKEMTPIKNELEVKKATLKSVSVGDNVDAKKANNLIEEIGDLKTEMAKKQFAQRQKVRNILNDEQKILFDAHAGNKEGKGRGGKNGQMMKRGMKNGERSEMRGEGPRFREDCPALDAEFDSEIES
jgi:Spy/CpxP family protein refolding chaperone